MRWLAPVLVVFLAAPVSAQDSTRAPASAHSDNPLLQRMFDEDQGDRKTGQLNAETAKRDARRREQVLRELRAGRLRTASDYYHAAMVFQHGESADEIRLAFSLAWTSAQMDEKKKDRALWLSAAAWDRLMMRLEKPQWYGTQYVTDGVGTGFRLYETDEDAVTDQERIRLSVPVLSEAKKRAEFLNQRLQRKPGESSDAPKDDASRAKNGNSISGPR